MEKKGKKKLQKKTVIKKIHLLLQTTIGFKSNDQFSQTN